MKKNIMATVLMVSLLLASTTLATDYPYKKVSDFKTLESYDSVEDFESSYGDYSQHCLDNTFGGTGGIPCLIGHDMWDRELNIYYEKLMKLLSGKEKALLKDSQLAWLAAREKSSTISSALLDKKYTEAGTMYLLMRAEDADSTMTSIVKQRVLLLKEWLELLTSSDKEEDGGGGRLEK